MEKISLKRTIKKKKFSKKIAKVSSSLLYFILVELYLLCYKKRRALFLFLMVSFFCTSILISFKYVQAKMDETSSFSDKFILDKVRKHINLPDGNPISLVRVVDGASLRKEHPFYAKVKEGDYIIGYTKIFVIYDAVHDEIKAVKESMKE